MTKQHPITPPPELVQDWAQKAQLLSGDDPVSFAELLCNKAARWGADMELEACCEWLGTTQWCEPGGKCLTDLRASRRPKPPSPKEEALQVLENLLEARRIVDPEYQALRHALEQLDD